MRLRVKSTDESFVLFNKTQNFRYVQVESKIKSDCSHKKCFFETVENIVGKGKNYG